MGSIERIDPHTHYNDLMYPEHLGRYMFASQFTQNMKVVDCSSGNGYGSFYLASSGAASVSGIDIAEEAISYCKQHYVRDNLSYRVGDIRNLDWISDRSVDVFICFETIEHVTETDRLLSEIHRVLSANGLLLISCPNDYIFEPDNPFHVKRYQSKEFMELVAQFFKRTKMFVQNNTLGTSIYSSEDIQTADVYQPPMAANSHPIQAKVLDDADTWLLVCAKDSVDLTGIKPTVSFFYWL
ncbi:class I SAM-dependent methyltransferase [Cohnella rhizosphaerae]|uniref:Class I SAM-dependent methyltransferase n=1 Tax=Cohnella rhizosphaerae TaxID=1457232 RepID=A0A9X4QUK0_9BACL|nr:class I SAM-dependent methyltransferase [Cohnella rhizosphaerae]MDG0811810.1 class I SAM-dependent methyltransferase [Cohnella rhizosphaerae]